MPIPKDLAARAVLELTDGRKVYLEVRDGSPFVHFYTVRIVDCRNHRRKVTECPGRSRNYAANIDDAAAKMAMHFNTYGNAKVAKTTIRIYRKRMYEKRCRLRPDELGLAHVYNDLSGYLWKHQKLPVSIIRKVEAALA